MPKAITHKSSGKSDAARHFAYPVPLVDLDDMSSSGSTAISSHNQNVNYNNDNNNISVIHNYAHGDGPEALVRLQDDLLGDIH